MHRVRLLECTFLLVWGAACCHAQTSSSPGRDLFFTPEALQRSSSKIDLFPRLQITEEAKREQYALVTEPEIDARDFMLSERTVKVGAGVAVLLTIASLLRGRWLAAYR